MKTKTLGLCAGIAAGLGFAASVDAAVLFEESFDSEAAAKVNATNLGQNSIDYVDYSNFSVDGTAFSIGSAQTGMGTNGVLIRSNYDEGVNSGVQFYALEGLASDAAALKSFNGNYIMKWDTWQNMGVPLAATGSTEWSTYGVGRDADTYNGYANASFQGTWGVNLTGGDFNTWDYRIAVDGTVEAEINNESAEATAAFPSNDIVGTPINAWTHWELVVDGDSDNVKLYANGEMLFDITSAVTDGYAYIGYSDRYSSVNSDPVNTWAILDNLKITDIPEPASLALFGLGGLAMLRRRK
ncbi:PEP-CTERM motif protein [Poriferisphaera corsica]|uniref:PEP-CTERM motif protein n=1 Tax=Poriferisphaera corsica TaxID=2528020 RepID=A0A517YXA5_9BACT|nr:PEP-CTERM sorting domain-containing protein [Poriferisphaera corsica]QDU34847.1 PEP-CTERM motif protein [Poriferisphaera corsica]